MLIEHDPALAEDLRTLLVLRADFKERARARKAGLDSWSPETLAGALAHRRACERLEAVTSSEERLANELGERARDCLAKQGEREAVESAVAELRRLYLTEFT